MGKWNGDEMLQFDPSYNNQIWGESSLGVWEIKGSSNLINNSEFIEYGIWCRCFHLGKVIVRPFSFAWLDCKGENLAVLDWREMVVFKRPCT